MDSSSSSKKPARLLTQAAVQGIVTGLTLLGCQTTTDRTSVNAPMEPTSASSSSSVSIASPGPTQARDPIVPIVPRIVSAERDHDCCNGKNECKGKSGCASNADGSCGFGHDCKGKNECKGKGTACDFSDDAANSQAVPQPLPTQPRPPPPPVRRR